jgi:ankyrin repeat protein
LISLAEADSKDSYGRTPLSLAAGSGHEAVVKLLLDIGKVDADSKDNEDQTSLS